MESIGKQIGKLRQSAGVTQEKLGQALGVTTQAVSRWECGGTPDASLLPAIAEFFQVSIDELFGREGKKDGESLEGALERRLAACPEKERYEQAYQLCNHIRNGILSEYMSQQIDILGDDFGDKMGGIDVYSSTIMNQCVVWTKVMKDDHSFCYCIHRPTAFAPLWDERSKPILAGVRGRSADVEGSDSSLADSGWRWWASTAPERVR